MKKVLVLVIALCLIASFSACSQSATPVATSAAPATTEAPAASSAAATATPASAETVTLTGLMAKHALTEDFAKMDWLTAVEKKAGVNITWQQVVNDGSWTEKKGTMLASGDLPDFFMGAWTISNTDIAQFPGLFADLTPYLAEAQNVQTMFTEHPETLAIAKFSDGKIYGFPNYLRFWPKPLLRQYINKDWLTKLNLQVPTTWDELYNVLVAFKTKDPNGNGKADEIPMDWAPGMGGFNATAMLNGYGICTNLYGGYALGTFVDNGVVKCYYTDPRYKELVQFLNKCWNAGLINPETFTNDYTKYQAATRGEDASKVGFTWGWSGSDRFGAQWYKQYEAISTLKPTVDYNGPQYWDYSYDNLNYYANCFVMSTKCKNPEAAVRLINEFYNPSVSIQVLFGSIPQCISDDGQGNYAVLPPTDSKIDPGTWKWTNGLADIGPEYISDKINLKLGVDMKEVADDDTVYDSLYANMDVKKNTFPFAFVKMTSDDLNTMAPLWTACNNLQNSSWSKWITKGGIDNEWDSYVQNMNNAGISQILPILQKYYDDYYKK